jgi:acetyltransferase
MGFSYFIALGDSLDIDVDELLDFLARDSKTSAILLYLEHLSDARRFVSASRSARAISRSWLSKAAAALRPSVSCSLIPAWIPPGMPPFSARGCCGCRIRTSFFRR